MIGPWAWRRDHGDAKVAFLRHSALGAQWSTSALRDLARAGDVIEVLAGYPLIILGQRVVAVYLLLHGALVEAAEDDASWIVTETGSLFAVAEAVSARAAASTVTALEPSTLLALPVQAFAGGLDSSRSLRAATIRELAQRAIRTRVGSAPGPRSELTAP